MTLVKTKIAGYSNIPTDIIKRAYRFYFGYPDDHKVTKSDISQWMIHMAEPRVMQMIPHWPDNDNEIEQ